MSERYSAQLRQNRYNAGPYRDGTCISCGKTSKHTPNGFNCPKCKRSRALSDYEIDGRAPTKIEAAKEVAQEKLESILEDFETPSEREN